ncbi:alpha-crystallin A chain-like [Schistocerca americana]|uniref:alpha-crystallin A chain-like n=1 Tax=Schistocerca americana TaxID=7009 RepID=UPI001F50394F|nr:alpha-crystallin A chain-like [Schistocerca americana]
MKIDQIANNCALPTKLTPLYYVNTVPSSLAAMPISNHNQGPNVDAPLNLNLSSSPHYRHLHQLAADDASATHKVSLDVQQFRPDEISVKKIDDFVVVEGKHDERKDGHGYVSRQFTRRYRLPDDIEVDQMVSKLSADGVLTITAPKKTLPPSESRERIVPIVHTNQPAVAQSAPSRESGDNEIQETIVQ